MKPQDNFILINEDTSLDDINHNLMGMFNIIHDSDDISSMSETTKTIAIRGIHVEKLIIPYNYSLEKKRGKNLVANLGQEPSTPSIDLVD
jgi:hypothetical protein